MSTNQSQTQIETSSSTSPSKMKDIPFGSRYDLFLRFLVLLKGVAANNGSSRGDEILGERGEGEGDSDQTAEPHLRGGCLELPCPFGDCCIGFCVVMWELWDRGGLGQRRIPVLGTRDFTVATIGSEAGSIRNKSLSLHPRRPTRVVIMKLQFMINT
jgi:hypothetical protein